MDDGESFQSGRLELYILGFSSPAGSDDGFYRPTIRQEIHFQSVRRFHIGLSDDLNPLIPAPGVIVAVALYHQTPTHRAISRVRMPYYCSPARLVSSHIMCQGQILFLTTTAASIAAALQERNTPEKPPDGVAQTVSVERQLAALLLQCLILPLQLLDLLYTGNSARSHDDGNYFLATSTYSGTRPPSLQARAHNVGGEGLRGIPFRRRWSACWRRCKALWDAAEMMETSGSEIA